MHTSLWSLARSFSLLEVVARSVLRALCLVVALKPDMERGPKLTRGSDNGWTVAQDSQEPLQGCESDLMDFAMEDVLGNNLGASQPVEVPAAPLAHVLEVGPVPAVAVQLGALNVMEHLGALEHGSRWSIWRAEALDAAGN